MLIVTQFQSGTIATFGGLQSGNISNFRRTQSEISPVSQGQLVLAFKNCLLFGAEIS